MLEENFPGGFGVNRIRIIQKRRPKNGRPVYDKPEKKKGPEIDGRTRGLAGISRHFYAAP